MQDEELFTGLRELKNSAFPKRCGNCSREYRNSAEFLAGTQPLRANSSGLKQSLNDDGLLIVELFRNCVCGSTLLESFGNRRLPSEDGEMQRMQFHEMVGRLIAKGYPENTARGKLVKLMHEQPDILLNPGSCKNAD